MIFVTPSVFWKCKVFEGRKGYVQRNLGDIRELTVPELEILKNYVTYTI